MKLSPLLLLVVKAAANNPGTSVSYPAPDNAECLVQANFTKGTLVIDTPGVYKLCDDIIFGPNGPAPGELPAEDAFDPVFADGYSANGFGLGFFCAIAVASSDVTIHLDGKTIQQSPGHALMQRFFAVIELASAPFIEGVGPAQFVGDGEVFSPAKNVQILGPGTIGLSSHHGIHGNGNEEVLISGVKFRDFEVAAVSLNNVDNLEISHCEVEGNRKDVPVVGLFSAARFLRPYGKYLAELNPGYKLTFNGQKKTAAELYGNLITSINTVYDDVINVNSGEINKDNHPEEHKLFANPFRVIDGPCYAFLVHGKGPAVGGQGEVFEDTDNVTSSDVVITDNIIKDMTCWNNEVPALLRNGTVMSDPRHAVFQTVKTFGAGNLFGGVTDDRNLAIGAGGVYQGNVVSDMQIMVAKAIIDGIIPDIPSRQTGSSSIDQGLIDWALDGTTTLNNIQYICNGDSMHHVVKGTIVIRIEDTRGFSVTQNRISNIENLSVEPFDNCAQYHAGASSENANVNQAGNIRAISVAAVRGSDNPTHMHAYHIRNNEILDLKSSQATEQSNDDVVIIGIDVQGDSSGFQIMGNQVNLDSNIGEDPNDSYIALRLRENVTSVNFWGNQFAQETQVLNTARMLRRLKKLPGHASGDIEWKAGGCPYAASYKSK